MRIEDLFKRLKREYIKVNLLQSALDSIILVLIFNLVAFATSLDYRIEWLAAAGLTVFIFDFHLRNRDYSVELYEEKNPRLYEVLRTGRDNLDRRDTVTQALFDDLLNRSRKISSESIIPAENVIKKFFLIGFLAIFTSVSGLIAPEIDHDFNIEERFSTEGGGEDFLRDGSEVMGDSEDINSSGSDIDVEVNGSGESFEEGSQAGFEDNELRFEASPSRDEDFELARRYSVAIKELE